MTEKDLHKQICLYLKLQYPNIIFNTDMSGIRLTPGQARQAKGLRSSNGFPDIVIYKQGSELFNYSAALFLEVKKETPYKKDGSLKTDVHLSEQAEMHKKLINLGYHACFVWSFDQAKGIIDKYICLLLK